MVMSKMGIKKNKKEKIKAPESVRHTPYYDKVAYGGWEPSERNLLSRWKKIAKCIKASAALNLLDLSGFDLKGFKPEEVQSLLVEIPESIESITFSEELANSKTLFFLLPPWIKKVNTSGKSIELDDFLAANVNTAKYKPGAIGIISDRLVYEVRQAFEKSPAEPDLQSIRLYSKLPAIKLEVVESDGKKTNYDDDIQHQVLQQLELLHDGDMWAKLTAALIHDKKLACQDEKTSTKAVYFYAKAILVAGPHQSYCFQQLIDIAQKNNSAEIAYHLFNTKKSLEPHQPESGFDLDNLQVFNRATCDDLKTISKDIIQDYVKVNKTYGFSLFDHHGKAGRVRAENLQTTLANLRSECGIITAILTFLHDPANGNYNQHSLRIMLLTNLLKKLAVPGRQEMGRIDKSNYYQALNLLEEYLPHNPFTKPVIESGCCSFGA